MKVYSAPESIPVPSFQDAYVDGRYNIAKADLADAAYIEMVRKWIAEHGQPHPLNGTEISTHYADGSARYIVGKFNGSVSLFHLPLGDAWHDDQWCRLMTITEIKRIKAQDEARAKFWAERFEFCGTES